MLNLKSLNVHLCEAILIVTLLKLSLILHGNGDKIHMYVISQNINIQLGKKQQLHVTNVFHLLNTNAQPKTLCK